MEDKRRMKGSVRMCSGTMLLEAGTKKIQWINEKAY